MTLEYVEDSLAGGTRERGLDIYRLDRQKARWRAVGGPVDPDSNEIEAEITRLTTYVIASDRAPHAPPRLKMEADTAGNESTRLGKVGGPLRPTAASAAAEVYAEGTVDFGATGGELRFPGVVGAGQVTVTKRTDPPANPAGISESNVGSYRYVVEAESTLSLTSGRGDDGGPQCAGEGPAPGPFPNPARGQATVRLAPPKRQEVTLRIYDVLGRRVATLQDGRGVQAGWYLSGRRAVACHEATASRRGLSTARRPASESP